jgi:isopentenyl phosphate kinase
MQSLVFLKLGGALITEKTQAHTPRPEVISRLAKELKDALAIDPELGLVLGHGSGSFGHVAAAKYQTQAGVHTPHQWEGFVDVWHEARALNQIMLELMVTAGLPVLAFPPSAGAIAEDGILSHWDTRALEAALNNHLIPVLNGDVAFDAKRGGTILSTETVFAYLAQKIKPARIALAGIEPGVWQNFPQRDRIIPVITPQNFPSLEPGLKGSSGIDVTGGMAHKVSSMLNLVKSIPGLEITIFSGEEPGCIRQVLQNKSCGTVIRAN